ncbi:MAG: cytochrome c [Spirochaetota bacterium]
MKYKLIFFISIFTSSSVLLARDAAAGKRKSSMCASCHGYKGISSNPSYPNLAGQKKAYLINAMQAYKSGQRTGRQADIMASISLGLSKQDIKDLAEYYSRLK